MRIFLLLFLLLNCFANSAIAQSESLPEAKISKLVDQAWEDYKESNFEKSLITSRIALNYATISKNDLLIAKAYKIIAGNYSELSEFDKAIFFYNKGLFYANKTDDD
ncbi:hybrid sensor histidine kinase/response regulator, partial [Flavobacterium sp. HMWF030]